jgi:polyhydroxyalkanoate synthesis regulator phasin
MKETINQILRDLGKAPELVLRDVESNTQRLVSWAVERGKLSAEDARQILSSFAERPKAMAISFEDTIDRFIRTQVSELSLPRKDELTALRQRVNRMIDRADQLETLFRAKLSGKPGTEVPRD